MATAPCEDPLSPLSPIAGFSLPSIPWSTLSRPSIGDDAMLSPYSLPDMLERIYENQLALEAGSKRPVIPPLDPRLHSAAHSALTHQNQSVSVQPMHLA